MNLEEQGEQFIGQNLPDFLQRLWAIRASSWISLLGLNEIP